MVARRLALAPHCAASRLAMPSHARPCRAIESRVCRHRYYLRSSQSRSSRRSRQRLAARRKATMCNEMNWERYEVFTPPSPWWKVTQALRRWNSPEKCSARRRSICPPLPLNLPLPEALSNVAMGGAPRDRALGRAAGCALSRLLTPFHGARAPCGGGALQTVHTSIGESGHCPPLLSAPPAPHTQSLSAARRSAL